MYPITMDNPHQKLGKLSPGDAVNHIVYGNGSVVSIKDGYTVVQFKSRQAMFKYPDAFEKGFLSMMENKPKENTVVQAPKPALDIEMEATALHEKYLTTAELESHFKENVAIYGITTYRLIEKKVKELIRLAKEQKEQFLPERAYSQEELTWQRIVMSAIFKNTDGAIRQIAAEMKGRYHSMTGIIAACYPHQGETGRPAIKKKNPNTGVQEWHSYKRISYESLLSIFQLCYDNYLAFKRGKHNLIVDVHLEGEPIAKKTIDIKKKADSISSIQACLDQLEECQSNLEMARDDEQDAYDNLPEGLQDSERGDIMSNNVDALDEAVTSLDDAVSYLHDIIDNVDEDMTEESPWDELKEGCALMHKSFGKGYITSIDAGYIIVKFDTREARFRLPDAFIKEQLFTEE